MTGSIDRAEVVALLDRRDAPGLVHVATQLAALAISGVATVRLAAAGHPAWPVALLVTSVAILSFFPAMHEAGHRTAFRSAWLNDVTTAIGAFVMLQAPTFFREFHFEHHRETQNREKDPEIAGAPDFLSPWPRNLLHYAALVSGVGLMVGKAAFTIVSCVLPTAAAWEKAFPFVRPELRSRVAWESRLVVALWVAFVYAGLRFVDGFAALLLAWPLAHLLLGFYLLPEHRGLPHEGSQLEITRTVTSNAPLRWLMWNMPYHAEHHAHPAVPFHALPALHARLAPHLPHTAPGYLAFHREAIARAVGAR